MALTPTVATNQVGTRTITYTSFGASTDGVAVEMGKFPIKCVQAYGVFGGTVTIQGTNDPLAITNPAGAVWATLTSEGTTAITYTAAGLKKIYENPRFIRAITGAGVSAATVIFECSKA